jgi:alkylresorcinol/alkylpyrone synthase
VPAIASIATAVPAFSYTVDDAKQTLKRIMPLPPERMAAIEAIFDNALVDRRHSPFPLDYVVQPRPLEKVSGEYRQHAIALGTEAAQACLDQAGVDPREIDFLITVSCTGIMIPSLDAYIINQLGFRPDTRRLPITELGCSAGVSALAYARELLLARPQSKALVLAVELPSLTFQGTDTSIANLVSCALFGDGAAAALVQSDASPGFNLIDSQCSLFRDSYDALGFELKQTGLSIVLGKHLASLIRCELRPAAAPLLERAGLNLESLSFFVLHPGGRKLLEASEQALGISREKTQPAWDLLRNYGNLSSASVLFLLDRFRHDQGLSKGDLGLMVGFGPGFSIELLLLECA